MSHLQTYNTSSYVLRSVPQTKSSECHYMLHNKEHDDSRRRQDDTLSFVFLSCCLSSCHGSSRLSAYITICIPHLSCEGKKMSSDSTISIQLKNILKAQQAAEEHIRDMILILPMNSCYNIPQLINAREESVDKYDMCSAAICSRPLLCHIRHYFDTAHTEKQYVHANMRHTHSINTAITSGCNVNTSHQSEI